VSLTPTPIFFGLALHCWHGILEGMDMRDSRAHNYPPRWNAAPSLDLLVIRRNHETGEVSVNPLRWGLIPYWCKWLPAARTAWIRDQ
jgi:putative SOS response-associated peptidase YedK